LADTAPDAELLALLGTTYAALADEARAESCYRRALYLDPSHSEALLHLALILDRRGDSGGANRLRMRARRGVAAPAPVKPSERA
jgi:chemotaxis protein methyltransferase WspC